MISTNTNLVHLGRKTNYNGNMDNANNIKRGDIWIADLGDGIGSEQKSKRPVLVVQNNKGNKYSSCVTIIPITSQVKNNLPTHVSLHNETFLLKESIVIVEQIRTIDKLRLKEFIGEASEDTMAKVDFALDVQIKEFDEKKAFELYEQVLNMKILIDKIGRTKELIKACNFLSKEFKNYCEAHLKDYKVIKDQLKNNYFGLKQMYN